MSYDDGKYTAKKMYGPIWATFAQVIATVTTKVQTSAVSNDRVEFMRKIKATGFKFLTQTGTTQGGSAADYAYSVRLMAGSDIIGTAPVLGSLADGVMADGVLVASNVSKISGDEALSLIFKVTPNGTAHTSSAMSGEAFLEYQTSYL